MSTLQKLFEATNTLNIFIYLYILIYLFIYIKYIYIPQIHDMCVHMHNLGMAIFVHVCVCVCIWDLTWIATQLARIVQYHGRQSSCFLSVVIYLVFIALVPVSKRLNIAPRDSEYVSCSQKLMSEHRLDSQGNTNTKRVTL